MVGDAPKTTSCNYIVQQGQYGAQMIQNTKILIFIFLYYFCFIYQGVYQMVKGLLESPESIV